MQITRQLQYCDPTKVLLFFQFEVQDTPFPYVRFSKNGFPDYLVYQLQSQNIPACFDTSGLCTISTPRLFMQLTFATHFQSLSDQIKSIVQTDPIRLSIDRELTEQEIINRYLRLFPFKSNQYLESSGFDLDEIQFMPIKRHLYYHNSELCTLLLYNLESGKPTNSIVFNSQVQQLTTTDYLVCNSIISNPEFPNLICAFPDQVLSFLHFTGETCPCYNLHIIPEIIAPDLITLLFQQLQQTTSLCFLHTSHLPMLIHNLKLQIGLIYHNQQTAEGKSAFYFAFEPDTKNLKGTLTIAKPAGAWSRRDTSLFSNMNIRASQEFSDKPQQYVQDDLDDLRLFSYNRFSEPALQGIRVHFHFKSQLFKIIVQVLCEHLNTPFEIKFIHLNTYAL